jgi:hypothetical protein
MPSFNYNLNSVDPVLFKDWNTLNSYTEIVLEPNVDTTLQSPSSVDFHGVGQISQPNKMSIACERDGTYLGYSDAKIIAIVNGTNYTYNFSNTDICDNVIIFSTPDACGNTLVTGFLNPYCPMIEMTQLKIVVTIATAGAPLVDFPIFKYDTSGNGVYLPLYFGGTAMTTRKYTLQAGPSPATFRDPAGNVSNTFEVKFDINEVDPANPDKSLVSVSGFSTLGGGEDYSIEPAIINAGSLFFTVYSPNKNVSLVCEVPLLEDGAPGRYKISPGYSFSTDSGAHGSCHITNVHITFVTSGKVARGYSYTGYLTTSQSDKSFNWLYDSIVLAEGGKVFFTLELITLNYNFPTYRSIRLIGIDPIFAINGLNADANAFLFTVAYDGNDEQQSYYNFLKETTSMMEYIGQYLQDPSGNFVSANSYETPIIGGSEIRYDMQGGGEPAGENFFGSQAPVSLACLLKGTILYNEDGSRVPIEFIKEGDTVMTVAGPKKVLEVGHWVVPWEAKTHMNNKAMFRVEKGTLGAEQPVYLSYWHQVRCADGVMRPAAASRLPRARKDEICEPGSSVYHLYHVCVEDYANSHLIVNGGCTVESWSGGEGPRAEETKIELARATEEIVSF